MAESYPGVSSRDLWRLVDAAFALMNEDAHLHHQRVSYLAYHMAEAAELPPMMRHLTLQAAYLHDVGGAIGGQEISLTDIEASAWHISQISANLLEDFPAFATLAVIVRYCQSPYRKNRGLTLPKLSLPGIDKGRLPTKDVLGLLPDRLQLPKLGGPLEAANIIHLADAVSLLFEPDVPVLNQVAGVLEKVRTASGDEYAPKAMAALEKLASRERIWLDMAYCPGHILDEVVQEQLVDMDAAMQMSRLVSMVIDFRSPFTAMHSAGVAASAKALARLAGMDAKACEMMEIAGNLHDLGKIRTPKAILEKPGKLTGEEFNVIKEHAYFTDVLLSRVRGFEEIRRWAALHHEKLNGAGYPYHLTAEEIPLGAKIMAVADVFSAITEDRPYRKGMPAEKVRAVLRENAEKGELSAELVELLVRHYDEVNAAREKASHEMGRRYYRSMRGDGAGEKADE